MDDLISRQAAIATAIKAAVDWHKLANPQYSIAYCIGEAMRQLPPANTSETPNSSDTISRQAVKEILDKDQLPYHKYPYVWDEINALPPAQPERIKGHWIEIALSNHTYKCSVCGRLLVNITDGKNNVAKNYPYCHCGADMRGEQDE